MNQKEARVCPDYGKTWTWAFSPNFPLQLCDTYLGRWAFLLTSLSPFFLYLSFHVQLASLTLKIFLPSSSLLNSYASCAKLTNGICSLSLSLLLPTYQDKTGASRLQWRQEKMTSCVGSADIVATANTIQDQLVVGLNPTGAERQWQDHRSCSGFV